MFQGNNSLNYSAYNGNINNNFNNNFNNMNIYNNQMQFNENYAPNNNVINPLNRSYSCNFFQTQNYRNQFNNNQMNLINNNNVQNNFNYPMNNIMNFNNFQNNMNMNINNSMIMNNNIQNDFIDNNSMKLNINQNNLSNQMKKLNLNLNKNNNKNKDNKNNNNSQNMEINQIIDNSNSDNENENVINYTIKESDLQIEENLSKVTENIVSTMERTINIYNQIKNNCICAIPYFINDNINILNGFFCYIPYKNKKITVLMTSWDTINFYNSYDKLIFIIDNYKTSKTIKMNKNRILYSSETFNLAIIEIYPEDNLNEINFLELDENLFENNSEIIYENKSLYILYYQKEKGALISYGSLNKKVSHNLIHLCKVEESSEGAPILNLENNKVIGIHISSKKNPYYNKGIFLKYPINDLNKIKNQIKIIVKVNEDDISKEVYFLNQDNNYIKELNENNTKLFINNKEYKYKKYFRPKKEGNYSIVLKLNTNIKDCSFMFYNCHKIIEIDLSLLSSNEIVNMDSMFSKCNIKYLDLYSFNKNNVTSMRYLFAECWNLEKLDLLDFNTAKVKDMSGMFSGCTSLTNLNLNSFNTKNVTNMSNMFHDCSALKNINLSSFSNNKKLINMSNMFSGCKELANIDLSTFDTKNVIDMSNMFSGSGLVTINLSSLDIKNVTNMSNMFSGCKNLTNIDLSSLDAKNVIDMSHMFSRCDKLTNINFSSFETQNLTDMSNIFSWCQSLTTIDLSSFNTNNVTDMSNMFFNCNKLKEVNLSNFESNKVQNMKWMFYWCGELLKVDFSSFDLNKVKNKSQIFGLSSFDKSNEYALRNRNEVKTIKVNKNSYEEFKKQVTAKKANFIII